MKYFLSFIFIPFKRDRGGKCTWLSVFQWIQDCNCATSVLLLHHPCDPGSCCKQFPTLQALGAIPRNVEHWGWSYQRGIDVLDGQEPVVDAVHFLVFHTALSESKHTLLSHSSQIPSHNADKTRLYLFLFFPGWTVCMSVPLLRYILCPVQTFFTSHINFPLILFRSLWSIFLMY